MNFSGSDEVLWKGEKLSIKNPVTGLDRLLLFMKQMMEMGRV
jgi:hypothetical protein